MRRLRIIIYAGLAGAWFAFTLWQYRDYLQQEDLIEESLHQQSRSIMTALVGGLRSHRRLGRYFEDQLQGMLDELVKSDDVVFVAIRTPSGEMVLSAGDAASSLTAGKGSVSQRDGSSVAVYFRLLESFVLNPAATGPRGPGSGGRGSGLGGGLGGGQGAGLGAGRGRGVGARRGEESEPTKEEPFGAGGSFTAELVLDRSRADELSERIAWSHQLAAIAAALVSLSIGLVWRATMNLTEAKGRTRVSEAETRHLRELSQAAAGLAHETRNPLGLIRGWTQRLAETTTMPEPERLEHSRAIMEECDRVTARINQFLAFARPYEPNIQSVNITDLADELKVIMQPDLETHQLQLDCRIPPELSHLQADFELLRQALFNLLLNAVHFSPTGSTIEMTVERQPARRATLQIADHGPGVQPDAVDSLFTPYFTTRSDGTGLGLAIVRHIAALHDWQVTYRARAGGGAIFEIGNVHVAD